MFNKIILNIPHSSTRNGDFYWKNKETIRKEITRWTDHATDILFAPAKVYSEKVDEVIFPYSRFYVDAERLINDPLEMVGQGRIYERFNGSERGEIPIEERGRMIGLYDEHIHKLSEKITDNSLIIDCHSFPSDLADVDICIGFNDDWSKPTEMFINKVKNVFEEKGYKVGINNPYSNSITPCKGNYKSIMIEVNKRCYLDENTNKLKGDFYKIGNLIQKVYKTALYE